MLPQLRDYQQSAIAGVRRAFGGRRRVLFVLPTGGGKTVVFSWIAHKAGLRGKRILIVAHRREIIEQISRALASMDVPHGLVIPDTEMTDDQVQVAMIQTAARRLDKLAVPDLLIVDEAHHAVAGSWQKLTDWLPDDSLILGVTATPQRLDGKGLGDAFDVIVEGPQTADLIAAGHLSRFDYFAPPPKVDLSAVRTRMGDYAVDALATAMDRPTVTGDAVQHYAKFLAGRPAIAFCVSVDHATHVAESFRSSGWQAASVDGSMRQDDRRARIEALGSGGLNVLTSCELISEGVDVPVVAGAILLRPTQSLAMYLQQIGRCLRLKPDGGNAIILDHVGNMGRHGLPDQRRTWSLAGRQAGAAPIRTCPTCYAVFPIGARPECMLGSECGLAPAPSAPRPELKRVDGELTRVEPPPAWAQGLDLARGPYRRLLALAGGNRDRLEAIAKARGYKRGWVTWRLEEHASLSSSWGGNAA